jgi:predicted dehydrogenase
MDPRVLPARRPRKVTVLGVGAMGRRHVRVLSQMPDEYVLVGVFDPDWRVAKEVAGAFLVPAYEDELACISAAEVVVIASPIEAHASSATRALERGCHVLVEKPLCSSAADAFALVRAASRNSASLFVGHSERFNPVIVALRALVRTEDVIAIAIRRATPPTSGTREHDVLLSLGVHDVDLVAYLTGGGVALRAAAGVRPSPAADRDRAELALESASGAVARLTADRRAPVRERTIELVTAHEVFEGDLLKPRLERRPRTSALGEGPRGEVVLTQAAPLAAQARAIAMALDGREQPRAATGGDGARALALVLEAGQALRPAPRPRGLLVPEAS